MLGLLPHDIAAILESERRDNYIQLDPARLRASLLKIHPYTWLRLGAICHNEGFAAEIKELLPRAKTSTGHLPELTENQQNQILYLENGMPRIVNTIQRHCRRDPQFAQDEALIWRMYLVYREHMPEVGNKKPVHRTGGRAHVAAATSTTPPWQLEFMKSGCPEIMLLAFHDIFMEHGERVGYEINIPKALVEVLDYEWTSGTSAAKRSVQALIQVLQGCLRYRKTGNTETLTAPAAGSVGLGVGGNGGLIQPGASPDMDSTPFDKDLHKVTHQMTLNLAEADSALQVFLESEAGLNFPKLREAFLQELEGQRQKMGEKPVRKIGGVLGYTPSPDTGVAKKRVEILMGEDAPEGSPLIGATGHDSPMTFTSPTWPANSIGATARKTADEPKRPLGDATDSTPKKLRTASQFVEYAMSGTWPDNNPTSSTYQTLTAPTARAQTKLNKTNNPLWSPILSLNFFPQAPNKYEMQLESELERWISLCGHMDGAVFADKLVSLIKDVYPSDQKFLMEQILVEFMCWDETEGRERDMDEMAVYSSVNSGSVCHLTKPSPRVGFKWAEKAVDTIMGALVALVIKPEENLSHVVRRTHRWLEPIELVPSEEYVDQRHETAEDPSVKNADSKGKRRKTRNLYNRRVSPFYAILSLFKPKRVEGRVTGMLYLTEQDIKDRTAERNSQESSATPEFEASVKKPRALQKLLNAAAKVVPDKQSQPVQPPPPPTPAAPKFVYAPNVPPKGTLPPAVASKPAHSPVITPKAVHPPSSPATSKATCPAAVPPQVAHAQGIPPNTVPPQAISPHVVTPPGEVSKAAEPVTVPGVGPVAMPEFKALIKPPASPPPKAPKVISTMIPSFGNIGATDPTYFSPELMLHLGPEVMEGITEPSPEDRILLSKPQAKRLKRMRQKHTKLKKAAEDLGEIYVPVMTGQFPGAEVFFDQLNIQLNADPSTPDIAKAFGDNVASTPIIPDRTTGSTNVDAPVDSSDQADVDMDAPKQHQGAAVTDVVESAMKGQSVQGEPSVQVEEEEDDDDDEEEEEAGEESRQQVELPVEERIVKVDIESEDVEMAESNSFDEQKQLEPEPKEIAEMTEAERFDDRQQSEPGLKDVDADDDQVMPDSGLAEASVKPKDEHNEDLVPRMIEDLPLKENLRLAKQAESMRMECHAPFRVLLRILQYLTKANQGVMLDLWIIESLSDTVEPLQVIYFEWMLRELIDTSPRPNLLPLKIDRDESIQLEEEILRLIPLLLAAPTIGRGPAVNAFKAVERSLKGHVIPRLGADTHPENRSYWERAQALLGL
ncbi:hypothetical protein BGZ97_005846 [Linnemannia gamsii]|uniref:Uncharacterized protein n=1 Tax=Linnemannia gamsii TaxID=64522 RepID=A0A9P6REE3_9FUNG|nr:hypothetical protein BGZ97_005846 [Linnemannia gamsii]